MLSENDLRGIYVPIVTPFSNSEELDLVSYRNYLSQLFLHDLQGIVINGTTGESATVAWNEVEQLVLATNLCMSDRSRHTPIVIGTGTNHTRSTIERTELAGQLGADAVLVVTPYYTRPSQEGIIEHYRRVAEIGVPIIAYEVPSRTGVRLSAHTIRKIMDLDGVIGLKDASGGIDLITELQSFDTKPIMCGEDICFYDMLTMGASGGILASANIHTNTFIRVFNLFNNGDSTLSKQTFETLVPYIQALFQESNPSPLKWLLAQQGTILTDTLRLPMGSISSELQLRLRELG